MIDGVYPNDIKIVCVDCSMLDDAEYSTDGILGAIEHVEGRGHNVMLSPIQE